MMHVLWREFVIFVQLFLFVTCRQDSKCQVKPSLCESQENSVSLEKSLVFGPGLKSDFTLPARYFFIQAVTAKGQNFTVSPRTAFIVKITEYKGPKADIWTQILNRQDGSFIVRFKLYNQLNGIQINITYNGKHVAASPYTIQGPQYPESCVCQQSLHSWLENMECPLSHPQIQKDLSIFPAINLGMALEDAIKRFNVPGAYSFCHYQIVNSKLYKKCFGQYVGFSMFMDEILLSLLRKISLPDTELLVNLGDWPLEHKTAAENPIPFFSWCGSENTQDIVMPTYDITESSLEMMGRVTLDVLSVQGSTSSPRWGRKQEIAFWRGRDSRLERLHLVNISRQYPDLIDAALTNFFFFQEHEKEYGPKADHISFFDFFKYKYQINIDGTVAAYRYPYLLAGGSLVLKQDSAYYEYFYSMLKPMIHYVPFKHDLSDLVEKINWAKVHDLQAKEIAENARIFVNENLMPQDILCYYALLLKEYTEKLTVPVILVPEMESVNQPVDRSSCQCLRDASTSKNTEKDEL